MVVAIALVPSLEVQAAWWSDPTLRQVPLSIAPSGGLLLAVCPRAATSGCAAGQTPGQARLCCPELRLRPPDSLAAHLIWQTVLAALTTVSPVVEAADPEDGVAYLAASGLERLWGDAAEVAARALTVLARQGVQALAGAGPTRTVALALAHRTQQGGPRALTGDDARAVLTALPLDDPALGVPPAATAALAEVGIASAGALARLPPAALALRIGPEVVAAWQRARGEAEPPLRPWQEPAALMVVEQCDDGLEDGEQLGALIDALAGRLAIALAARGQAAGLLTLGLGGDDGRRSVRQAQHALPLVEHDPLVRAARRLLAEIRPSAPVVEVWLRAEALCVPPVDAVGLWAAPGPAERASRLASTLSAHARRYQDAQLRYLRRDPLAPEGWRWDEVQGEP
jgi:nucleotidyltransferase/DNA polymerase involved in DNA repair